MHSHLVRSCVKTSDSIMTYMLVSLQVKARGPKLRGLGQKGGWEVAAHGAGEESVIHTPSLIPSKHNLPTPEVQAGLLSAFCFSHKNTMNHNSQNQKS